MIIFFKSLRINFLQNKMVSQLLQKRFPFSSRLISSEELFGILNIGGRNAQKVRMATDALPHHLLHYCNLIRQLFHIEISAKFIRRWYFQVFTLKGYLFFWTRWPWNSYMSTVKRRSLTDFISVLNWNWTFFF